MPRYFCDYCQTYLTHDSAPGRKQHNRGEQRAMRGMMDLPRENGHCWV